MDFIGNHCCLFNIEIQFSSFQLLSHVWLFATPWTAARQASLSITNSQSLLKHMSIDLVMPSNHLILCCPLLLLPSIYIFAFPSRYPRISYVLQEMATHCIILSWKIPWMEEPGRLQSMGSKRVRHNSAAKQQPHVRQATSKGPRTAQGLLSNASQ